MSKKNLDYDNLSENDRAYLRDRPWMRQHPDDVPGPKVEGDWDEDTVEVVPIGAPSGRSAQSTPSGDGNDGDADGDAENGDPDYEDMTVSALKAECHERDLPVGGNKSELIARLQEFDELNTVVED